MDVHHPDSAIYPSLRGKTVLISGGAEGIGAAAVELFCRQGSRVIFLDVAAESAAQLSEGVASVAGATRPIFLKCDVTDLGQLRDSAEQALMLFGGRVDVLINNAAAAGAAARRATADVTAASFEADINVNVRHHLFLTQAVAPAMQRQGGGAIINMGSISWRIPATGLAVYTMAKAAVMGLTRTHAREYGADGVRVNSIVPGAIATQRQIETVLTDEYRAECLAAQALKRVLKPVEVARLMLFLASDEASAITGASYVVDGGWVGDV